MPIQPDQGEKETLFEVQYHFAYNGRHALAVHPQMPADNIVVYTAKGIEFAGDSRFQVRQEDPRVETHVAKNVHPGDAISFTVSGEGEMPADATGAATQPTGVTAGGRPGGGIGAPIASPDPLTGSKTWLLGGFAVLLTGIALLALSRKGDTSIGKNGASEVAVGARNDVMETSTTQGRLSESEPHDRQSSLLETLKEELFTLEQDKIAGRLSVEEYSRVKVGLEAVLKRTLNLK